MIAIIILAVLGLALLITSLICFVGNRKLKKYTNEDSCIVFGKKGKGKSLLFSKIAKNCKKGYASNTDFKHKNGIVIAPSDVQCGNTWLQFLTNSVNTIEKDERLEKKPILLDDAGVYLPNFMDTTLAKKFPSMPVSFATWRHLYDAPIHINCQACDRVWKLLREQATYYIRVKGVTKFFGLGFIRWTIYDRHESAEKELEPLKGVFLNKYSKADVQNFKAMNGLVKNYMVVVKFSHHKYDSRYFHKVVFGKEAPKEKKLLQKIKNRFKMKSQQRSIRKNAKENSHN